MEMKGLEDEGDCEGTPLLYTTNRLARLVYGRSRSFTAQHANLTLIRRTLAVALGGSLH